MQIPATPPPWQALLPRVQPARLGQLLARPRPEVKGQYLHWDELRRRSPPEPWTAEEWWASVAFARQAVAVELPLSDKDGRPISYSRTDTVERLLHHIDREAGTRIETTDPQLANSQIRDRYIVRSLAEETIASSQLEGAATTRHVAKDMLLSGRPPQTRGERMIANNFRAMEFLRRHASGSLSVDLLLELHRLLTEGTLGDPRDVGRLRRPGETIFVQDQGEGAIVHVPPPAEELPGRLEKILEFANDDSDDPFVHPVVRAIALHFALAYEHPFVDGNGRTARALFYWRLLRSGYWLGEFLSISRVIRRAPSQYSRAFLLTETDGCDLTYFLIHQLEVVRHGIDDLHAYLQRKARELETLDQQLKSGSEWNHRQRALLTHALRHPAALYTIAEHQREHGIVYQTARTDLLSLESAGLLKRHQRGKKFAFTAAPQLRRQLRGKR